jgi:hypothetical protein
MPRPKGAVPFCTVGDRPFRAEVGERSRFLALKRQANQRPPIQGENNLVRSSIIWSDISET